MLLHSVHHGSSAPVLAALELIAHAKNSIYLVNFYIQGKGQVDACLCSALQQTSAPDIKIISNEIVFEVDEMCISCLDLKRIQFRTWRSLGLQCLHMKFILVDQKYVFIGGFNFQEFYFMQHPWSDLGILLESQDIVQQLSIVFFHLWPQCTVKKHCKKNLLGTSCDFNALRLGRSLVFIPDVHKENATTKTSLPFKTTTEFKIDFKIDFNSTNLKTEISKTEISKTTKSNRTDFTEYKFRQDNYVTIIKSYELLIQYPTMFFFHIPKSRAFYRIQHYLQEATKTIDIISPNMVDFCTWDTISKSVESKGVKIRIATNFTHNQNHQARAFLFQTEKSYFTKKKKQLKTNLEIRYVHWPKLKYKTRAVGKLYDNYIEHTKFFCVDNLHFYVGTFNLDVISMHNVGEIGIIISNAHIAQKMTHFLFEYVWNYATPMKDTL